MEKIVVGVSGASGSAYALAALRALRARGDVEIHLILSTQAKRTIELETEFDRCGFRSLGARRPSRRRLGGLRFVGIVFDRGDAGDPVLDENRLGDRVLVQRQPLSSRGGRLS